MCQRSPMYSSIILTTGANRMECICDLIHPFSTTPRQVDIPYTDCLGYLIYTHLGILQGYVYGQPNQDKPFRRESRASAKRKPKRLGLPPETVIKH